MITSCQIGLRWASHLSGGAERIFSELAMALPEAGVGFLGVVAGEPELAAQTGNMIHAFAPENAGTLARLRGARKVIGALLEEQKPSLLASHFAMYTFPILDKLRTLPFVMHFHGPWAMESGVEGDRHVLLAAKRFMEASVYRRADRLIVLSQAFRDLLTEQYGIAPERVRIVPGAVDTARFAPTESRAAAREKLGWPADRPILFCMRRLVHRMGLQQLIDALQQVKKAVPEVLCYIGGKGPIRTELEARVQASGLEENVRFLGFLAEETLPIAYRAADLSVVPTAAFEGFGLVAAESLAAGTPVMVTPVGGLPEVVQGLSTSLLFRSGSPGDMAEALTSVLRGDTQLPGTAECRAYAVAKFSRELMGSRTAAVYREVA